MYEINNDLIKSNVCSVVVKLIAKLVRPGL